MAERREKLIKQAREFVIRGQNKRKNAGRKPIPLSKDREFEMTNLKKYQNRKSQRNHRNEQKKYIASLENFVKEYQIIHDKNFIIENGIEDISEMNEDKLKKENEELKKELEKIKDI
ncbi:5133_t:CDS:1, partial [Cetraspora pellucida]